MKLNVIIDRPMGSRHPEYPDMEYPVNYGYVPGILAADGEAQDVYVLGVPGPLQTFTGELIAVIHREDDAEEKWVAAPEGQRFTREEIRSQTDFCERYFHTTVTLVGEE